MIKLLNIAPSNQSELLVVALKFYDAFPEMGSNAVWKDDLANKPIKKRFIEAVFTTQIKTLSAQQWDQISKAITEELTERPCTKEEWETEYGDRFN